MNQPHSLTFNGVLYLSLGFRQAYHLQVLTLRRGEQGELQLVLYDGNTYIGALYHQQCQNMTERWRNGAHMEEDQSRSREVTADNESQPQEYDVVRIFPLTITQNQPILIESLQVVQTGINCLLGREVITLEEFMRRRSFSRRPIKVEEEKEERIEMEMGRKMMKGEHENQLLPSNLTQPMIEADRPKSFLIDQDSHQRKEQARNEVPTQKNTAQAHESIILEQSTLLGNQQQQHRSQHQQSNSKEQADVQRFLSLVSSKSISQQGTFTLNKKTIQIDLQSMPETAPKHNYEKATMYIRDLYERMHRFRIICRVNHLSHFTSQRGISCIKLLLIDEAGDEIICMLYEKTQEKNKNQPNFVKGRSYVFENGEVKSDEGGLSLIVQWSGVTEIQRFMPSFVPGKMHRLGQIAKQASFFIQKAINLDNDCPQPKKPKKINICGIFKGFKDEPKLAKTLFRVHGILCDPDQELSIQFTLLVEELSSFPQQGSAVSLHNVHSIEDERTMRIQSTKKSYILNETGNTHEYFSDLLKTSSTKSWRLHEYRNLSDVTFVPRTISQLKIILSRMMEHDTAYSEIDCSIANLIEKKLYNSCSVCRRETRENGGMFVYCLSCKRNVKSVKRVQFDLEVQDSSGSLFACLFSDEMQGFVNISPQEYTSQSKEDRECFTDLCAYTQIIMRVKSCRLVGGADHKAVSATRFNHKRGLSQIKSMVIEEKTKYTPW